MRLLNKWKSAFDEDSKEYLPPTNIYVCPSSRFFRSGVLAKFLAKCINNDTVINATFCFPVINPVREKVSTCLMEGRLSFSSYETYAIL